MTTNKPKPLVLIFTADTGHTSIAESLSSSLSPHYQVEVVNIAGSIMRLYSPFYLFFPQLFSLPFKLAEHQRVQKIVNALAKRTYLNKITSLINLHHPQIVISTWNMYNSVFESLQPSYHFLFLNVVTDPRTFHSLIPSPQATNLVFDTLSANRALKMHIPQDKILITGWFVRPSYEAPYHQDATRRRLKLKHQTTLLIAAGSLGTNLILKIIPALILPKHPLTVIVACGTNKSLYQLIHNLSQVLKKTRPTSKITLIPLQFTRQLHRYLQAADLVVGKAGPNLLFESVATLTPFFAITHISGQEDGNLDLIKDSRLGYVEENPLKATRLLVKILRDPRQLKSFEPHLKQLAAYNHRSRQIILNYLQSMR